jgi:TonB-linked SusC/RagA family outer membrane protein
MKKITLTLIGMILAVGALIAQTVQVSGVVTDAADGQPLPGVSVVVKGTTVTSVTDANGRYTINVAGDATLAFSFIGMKTQEEAVAGRTTIDVTLEGSTVALSEVVVTALGMKRSERSVGYATATVKTDELNAAIPLSVLDGLSGKVAGVNISTGGGTGTSQKVIIRGVSSFSSNNPLYIVDGIPIRNTYTGSSGLNNATDFGTQAGDINPDDVESVTILKGASATALYGSRAANGVILITTKRGNTDSKVQVTYTGSVTASNVLRTPQFQNMFGEGWPLFDPMENGSWGPRLDGLEHAWGAPLTNGVYDAANGIERTKKFEFADNNIRNFYENGLEYNNNISISGGNKTTSFVLSYNNVTADGVIPGNADKYVRNTFSFRGATKYKRISAEYDVSYVRKDIDQVRGGQGQAANGGATTFQNLIQIPVDVSLSRDLKDINDPYNNVDNYFTPYAVNPYWIIQNNTSTYQDDRVYGKVEVNVEIIKGLTATGRLGGDFTNYRSYTRGGIYRPAADSWQQNGGKTAEPGYYGENYNSLEQIDAMALLNADYDLNEDFHVSAVGGWNFNQLGSSSLESYLAGLNVPNWYSLDNGSQLPTTVSFPKAPTKRIIGLLAQGDISYRNWAFLGLSLRNDWSSTLPPESNSFFYWGVNASVILTDAISALKNNHILSFLKIRGGWGQTGNDAPAYRTYSYFQPTKIGLGFGNLYLPLNNVAGLTELNTIPNMTLQPEITTELEFGFDVRFLDNRVGIDFAWYNRDTKNQIISATVAPETGYTSRTRNVGLINNTGIELRLYGTPVETKDFTWNIGVTFAKNNSEVKELWDDVQEYSLGSAYDVNFKAIKGQPLGVYQVPKIRKTDDGETVVNGNGFPITLSNEFETLGSSSPDFTMGFNTRVTYKGISLSAVIDWRQGGLFYSNTERMLDWNGNGWNTLFNERQPFLVPNSVKLVTEATPNTPAVYAENDIPVMTTTQYAYWNYSSYNKGLEGNAVLDRTYVKVRELTLSYAFPKAWFIKTPVNGLEMSIIGRNLFMWTAANNNYVDPEITNYGNDIASELGEFSAAPSVRTFGGSVRIIF